MKLILKALLLTVVYLILYITFSGLLIRDAPPAPAGQEQWTLPGLLLVALVQTLVLVQMIRMAAWSGWRLTVAMMVGFYGVIIFMSQIESLWFAGALGIPLSMVASLFIFHIPVTLLFVPLAVRIMGKWQATGQTASYALQLPWQEWVWKLGLIAILYLILYFGFGYFVAWQNPDLQQMYARPEGAWAFRAELLIPWQVLRGVLWGVIAVIVLRSLQGGKWALALMIGVLFALPMNIVHILPNPYMPIPGVRLSHFIETTTSNFILGVVTVYILLWRGKAKQ